jgi:erythronate-4-phosphate dehydrogenase
LLHQLDQQPFDCVLDVWEGEPWISRELFSRVWLGSPHVAGYSLEGKLRGSWMLLTALSRWAGEEVILPSLPQAGRLEQSLRDWRDVLHLLQRPWQIRVDHDRLAASLQEDQPALAFDELRKRYPVRHELSAFQLSGKRAPEMQRLVSLLSGG